MSWNSIVGQHRIQRILKTLWERDKLPHALLFFGPEGTGKEAVGIELARVLNCDRGGWDACGECPQCIQMQRLQHPRFKLVFTLPSKPEETTPIEKFTPDEMQEMNEQITLKAANPYHRLMMQKASEIKISSIRELRTLSGYRSERGRTVVLLCEADRLNASASNALLKTLEEPGNDMLFILATAKKDALLPTIVSRCQQLPFEALRDADIAQALAGHPDLDEGAIQAAVQIANGNYADALALARDAELFERSDVLEFTRAVMASDAAKLRDIIGRLTRKDNRRLVIHFLVALMSWFRDVMLLQEQGGDMIRNADFREPLTRFAAHYVQADCPAAIVVIEEIIEMIRKNVHLSLAFHVLAFRLKRCIQPR